jgi:very-short-patch-repair endonuclease
MSKKRDFCLSQNGGKTSKYYIFPQVHFSKIIYADGQQNFRNQYFNKIDRKSADFVLFDKATVSPMLVIEVDDSTHNRRDRVERDDFINSVLEKCGIPIVHVHPFVGEEELRREIIGKIEIQA